MLERKQDVGEPHRFAGLYFDRLTQGQERLAHYVHIICSSVLAALALNSLVWQHKTAASFLEFLTCLNAYSYTLGKISTEAVKFVLGTAWIVCMYLAELLLGERQRYARNIVRAVFIAYREVCAIYVAVARAANTGALNAQRLKSFAILLHGSVSFHGESSVFRVRQSGFDFFVIVLRTCRLGAT